MTDLEQLERTKYGQEEWLRGFCQGVSLCCLVAAAFGLGWFH